MNYNVKRPTGELITNSFDNLKVRFENGVIRAEWPAKSEGATEWTTVAALFSVEPASAGDVVCESLTEGTSYTPGPTESHLGAIRRYEDAYLLAHTATSVGAVAKGIGVILGLLVLLASIIVGSQVNQMLLGLVIGLLAGPVVTVPLYILGVLVAAMGQTLKASLDTAVHTSPFLKKQDMVKVLGL
jgi:hypothetical protein